MAEVQVPVETATAKTAKTGPGVIGVDVQEDLVTSTRKLLAELNLVGTGEIGAAGVSPIEADATNAAKFSAVAGGVLVAVAWAGLAIWWSGEETANQVAGIGAAALITAATVVGLAYLMITDIRSRTAAAVASTHARESIALAMIEASVAARQVEADAAVEKAAAEAEATKAAADAAAKQADAEAEVARAAIATAASRAEAQVEAARVTTDVEAAREAAAAERQPVGELVALPKKVEVRNLSRRKGDKKGWKAIAIERRGKDELRYLLVRGREKELVEADEVSFD